MKIYTKTGDMGETSLLNGRRVPKDTDYIEGYGTIDELNAAVGVSLSLTSNEPLTEMLTQIQQTLFEMGADLATPLDQTAPATVIRVTEAPARQLESWIDRCDAKLPPLKNFILPGGTPGGAYLHVCRTICRRAERLVTRLVREKKANPQVLIYLNRLSDLLFVLARAENHLHGKSETIWKAS